MGALSGYGVSDEPDESGRVGAGLDRAAGCTPIARGDQRPAARSSSRAVAAVDYCRSAGGAVAACAGSWIDCYRSQLGACARKYGGAVDWRLTGACLAAARAIDERLQPQPCRINHASGLRDGCAGSHRRLSQERASGGPFLELITSKVRAPSCRVRDSRCPIRSHDLTQGRCVLDCDPSRRSRERRRGWPHLASPSQW